jgi:hypothetical protein
MKRILGILVGLILLSVNLHAAEEAVKPGPVPELNLGWPYDLRSKRSDYAMELIFNPKAGEKYLLDAKKYYWKGYKLIQRYEGVADTGDPFLKDPYKVYSEEMWNSMWKQDFSQAYGWYTKALEIYTEKLQFDEHARSLPEYKDTLTKLIKGLVYTSVYVRNFFDANKYLDLYNIAFPDDKAYYLPWKIRVLGFIIEKQDAYNIGFSGAMRAESFKQQYKDYISQYLDMQKEIGEKTKRYIIDAAVPEYTTSTFNTLTLDTNYIK